MVWILAAVFPIVALAIKLDSPGAIFYKQERVGQHGAAFTVYKFRSMVQNAERNGKAQWAIKGDARITKVGNFIRKTRLDELPQVLNVLRGEMSMVGPRPERYQFIEELQKQIPFYRTRLAAKPGLTGWAQINYGYGSTTQDALIKLQYDLYYLKHWSPWLDFKILLRTFAVVLKMQGQWVAGAEGFVDRHRKQSSIISGKRAKKALKVGLANYLRSTGYNNTFYQYAGSIDFSDTVGLGGEA